MYVRRLCVLLFALPFFAGCEADNPTSPEGELFPTFEASSVGSRVTGSGHVPSGTGLREFTFHASEKQDGSVSGSYKIELTNLDLFFTVEVSCMTIEGNTAWVAGHISDTNASFIQVGSVSYFFAIDNGEGSGAPADVVSTARINDVEGEDLLFCSDRPLLLPSFPIQQGNVQVH